MRPNKQDELHKFCAKINLISMKLKIMVFSPVSKPVSSRHDERVLISVIVIDIFKTFCLSVFFVNFFMFLNGYEIQKYKYKFKWKLDKKTADNLNTN